MNVEVLKNFKTICEAGSINKASSILHISQPPLTKQMQNLEKELDTKLFYRSNSGIVLTEEGKLLYERANSFIAYQNLIKKEIARHEHIVRFGMTTSSVKYAIDILNKYTINHDISFDIHEKNTFELINQVNNDLIEFAFVRTPFDALPNINRVPLRDDHIILVGKEEFFKDIEGDTVTLKWLFNKPLIANRRWKNYIVISNLEEKVVPSYKYLCDDNRTAQSMAQEGLGIALLPSSEVVEIPSHMVSKVIEDNRYLTSIYLIYKNNRFFDETTKDFINFIINEAK